MGDYTRAFWGGDGLPSLWLSALSTAGITITPDLAMTLSAFYSGVSMIAFDLATLPCHVFKLRDDGGKDRIRGGVFSADGGIGGLAYRLRYQPNPWQTAAEFMLSLVAQLLLRENAYAEIRPGPSNAIDQLLPRHPDRVRPERSPLTGQLRYRLEEFSGPPRYLTQNEMFVVRGLSLDGGLAGTSRVTQCADAIGSAVAAEHAAGKFFKSGMAAAAVATYKGGEMDQETEDRLHASLTRYATGIENSFGLMLIPDDVSIATLAVEPEKAQMMQAREWGAREVARLLRIPPHKLGITGSTSYNSQIQASLDYVITCLRPLAVLIEQAMQRDLILAKDTYLVEFQLAALLRGDFDQQATYLEKLIRNRVMRPSEARLILNMNPDPELDRLSERDFQPGRPSGSQTAAPDADRAQATPLAAYARGSLKSTLAMHDNALRCLRRERVAVEKLARKHADDVDGWQAGLRSFFAEHAQFVAHVMRLNPIVARGYAAQHGTEWELKGLALLGEHEDGPVLWERYEADELTALALSDGHTVDDWFDRRLVEARAASRPDTHVTVPVTITQPAIHVDADPATGHALIGPRPLVAAVSPPSQAPTLTERVTTVERDPEGLIARTRTKVRELPTERVTEIERDEQGFIARTRTRLHEAPVPEQDQGVGE
jgi:HK97 family phage portal protein